MKLNAYYTDINNTAEQQQTGEECFNHINMKLGLLYPVTCQLKTSREYARNANPDVTKQ
jgi:hypothetical protein